MSNRKRPTTVYLTERQIRCLANLSRETHVPQAVYIRQAVDAMLEHHGGTQLAPVQDYRQASLFPMAGGVR